MWSWIKRLFKKKKVVKNQYYSKSLLEAIEDETFFDKFNEVRPISKLGTNSMAFKFNRFK